MRFDPPLLPAFAALLRIACLCWAGVAAAEVSLQITEGSEGAAPIAVVPFGGAATSENIGTIVAADLERSGRFIPLPPNALVEQPTVPTDVHLPFWRSLGVEYLAIGRVQPAGGGGLVAEFSAYDVVGTGPLLEQRLAFAREDERRAAHRIADTIYRQLTGEPGAFAAPIAYVVLTSRGPADRKNTLMVADSDGQRGHPVLSSNEPIMSPAWSPDGRRLAYVSFEGGHSAVYIQTLASGERQKVSARKGINGAPAFSPSGRELALTLSKDGNPDIYTITLDGGALKRVTDHAGIDTEPVWSPDGRSIVFTSNRGGQPQLYRVASTGGAAQRISFQGDYNARGRYSPDGRCLAMVNGSRGNYRIALMDLGTGALRLLTRGALDESPTFSPNGRMLLYSARVDGRARLLSVALEGGREYVLQVTDGEIRQVAWSPSE